MLCCTLLRAVGSSPRHWTARGLRRGCRRVLPHQVVMELDNPSHGDAKWATKRKPSYPYLARQKYRGEENHSRVADCTRLILSVG